MAARTTWGERVRTEREARGWDQSQLAKKTGLTQGTISKIENGKQSVSRKTMESIGRAFYLPVAEIFPYDDHPDLAVAV